MNTGIELDMATGTTINGSLVGQLPVEGHQQWTPDDGEEELLRHKLTLLEEQWDRITENGTVLSRYINSDRPMTFALCRGNESIKPFLSH